MLKRVFPETADNNFNGVRLAKWLLALFVAKSFLAGGIHMFAPDGGAQSIGSVVLDQFTAYGANTVITMFGLWGMEQAVIGPDDTNVAAVDAGSPESSRKKVINLGIGQLLRR